MRSFPWYVTSLLALSVLSACTPKEGTTTGPGPSTASAGQPMPALEICTTCATVRSITPVTEAGQTTGTGAVTGGNGGGAGVTSNIEPNRNAMSYTDVTLDMETGSQQTIRIDYPVAFGVGAEVDVRGTSITLR